MSPADAQASLQLFDALCSWKTDPLLIKLIKATQKKVEVRTNGVEVSMTESADADDGDGYEEGA